MSQFGDYARWFSKRFIIGVVITGIALAAWDWKRQGDGHAAIPDMRGTIPDTDEDPQKPKAEPKNCQSVSEGGLAPPSHPPVPKMASDNWPKNIRQLNRQDQRKRLYIYLPPNISMEEAERW